MRDFGSTRKLPSGRWQATYTVDGRRIPAPSTFTFKAEATDWLSETQSSLSKGEWIDRRESPLFGVYAKKNVEDRRLTTKSRSNYSWLMKDYLADFNEVSVSEITSPMVQEWFSAIPYESTAAKAYRLLSSIMVAAVDDGLIRANPCRVRGGSVERAPQRPVASPSEVAALAEAIDPRFRLFVLLGCWCQLRRGELLGLRPSDINAGLLTVSNTRVVMMNGAVEEKGPKTSAGNRTIAIPEFLLPEVDAHLEAYAGEYLFTGFRGGALSAGTLERHWRIARKKVGRTDLTVHDLRHSGLTLVGEAGATVAELMHRGGHSSPHAALRYQHASAERDRALAETLDRMHRPA